ncbi:Acetoin utilization protein AcuC [Pirellula sp. SH-Sr6A]|nr:Acetoin utilization protein AcuC [Pirellula sp. SH-Sr6A]
MSKYRLLRDRVVSNPVHASDVLLVPNAVSRHQLGLAHCDSYIDRVLAGSLSEQEMKRIGFPWSEKMVERSLRSSGATLAAARAAMSEGLAVNMAGGTHHAMRDAGEGFCVFNDAAVTIRTLLDEQTIGSALVVDCDVHQGNGTAHIMGTDPNVFTFSIHGAKNFPLRKHPSSLDVDLPDGTTDQPYLDALESALHQCDAAGPFDLMIYLAGADPFENDRLGRLKLTKAGLSARDQMVLAFAKERKIPTAIAMAGGYAFDIHDIVDIHAQTIAIASQLSRS